MKRMWLGVRGRMMRKTERSFEYCFRRSRLALPWKGCQVLMTLFYFCIMS